MNALIRRPSPLLVTPLRSVLAVAANSEDLICRLGGLLATFAESGLQVRMVCSAAADREKGRALLAAARELDVDEVVTVPALDDPSAGGAEDEIAGLVSGSDAVLVVGTSEDFADLGRGLVGSAAARAAAKYGRLLLEWLGPSRVPAAHHHLPVLLPGADPSDVFTLEVDRLRQRRALARLVDSMDLPTGTLAASVGHDRVRARHAPYRPRLERLRERLAPLLRPDATARERCETLHVLAAFARGGDWPQELLTASADDEPASHALHEDSAWSLATIVLRAGQATPPHRHDSWGAAVTILGVERNLRYAGWPEHPRFVDEQIAPVGGGYLFEPELCHQAVEGAGNLTVSLHLLIRRLEHPARGRLSRPAAHSLG